MPVPLHVHDQGGGRPLVLLHAFPMDSDLFAGVAPLLSDVRLIAPDLRGFGASPLGLEEPSMERMAEDVLAVLDRLGLDRVVLGGVSMGGYVSMALLRLAPERVAGVALLDTKVGADSDAARATRLATAARVETEGSEVLAPMVDALLGASTRARRPDLVAEVLATVVAAPPASVAWAHRAMASRPDSVSTLAGYRGPALVVVGEEDTLSPVEEAAALAAALGAGTDVRVIPEAGHLAVLEQPEPVAAALRTLLVAATTG